MSWLSELKNIAKELLKAKLLRRIDALQAKVEAATPEEAKALCLKEIADLEEWVMRQ